MSRYVARDEASWRETCKRLEVGDEVVAEGFVPWGLRPLLPFVPVKMRRHPNGIDLIVVDATHDPAWSNKQITDAAIRAVATEFCGRLAERVNEVGVERCLEGDANAGLAQAFAAT